MSTRSASLWFCEKKIVLVHLWSYQDFLRISYDVCAKKFVVAPVWSQQEFLRIRFAILTCINLRCRTIPARCSSFGKYASFYFLFLNKNFVITLEGSSWTCLEWFLRLVQEGSFCTYKWIFWTCSRRIILDMSSRIFQTCLVGSNV